MDVEKKKMDPEKKVKIIYSAELIIFSIVFLVLGILEMTHVITIKKTFSLIFRWVTIFGGTWLIVDLLWALFSKKRRKRVAIIDKIVMVPLGLYLIAYDIIGFVTNPDIEVNYAYYQFGMSSPFLYIGVAYIFQGIYHWFNPVPGLFDDIKEKAQEEQPQENVVGEVQPEQVEAPAEEEKSE